MPDPLVFEPPESREHIGSGGAPPAPNTPTAARQGQRLGPQFRSLQNAFDGRRAEIMSGNIEVDVDPELVVAFDLIGSIDGFYRAVERIDGLEFLADFEADPLTPDDDFFWEGSDGDQRSDEELPHSLYLVSTNARAIEELLSLWSRWVDDPDMEFPYGLARFRNLFLQLRAIRRWGPQDRLQDGGALDDWRARQEIAPQQPVPVEIELWFRADESLRRESQAVVEQAVVDAGGSIVDSAIIAGIQYHALLASIPRAAVQTVLDGSPDSLALLVTEEVMFVKQTSRVLAHGPEELPNIQHDADQQAGPTSPPRVAMFDGLPLATHAALADRVDIVDPVGLESEYPASSRRHGTSMASLIIHGDLSKMDSQLSSRLYVRPVLVPDQTPGQVGREVAPPDRLFVDVLHLAFREMLDGSPETKASTVKIASISIGDEARQFVRELSPLARLLDWVSHEYNVLILVSAGNHSDLLRLDKDIVESDPSNLQKAAIEYLHSEALNRRLLAPAESINALTIGACTSDESSVPDGSRIEIFHAGAIPAPYSARGTGFGRSVKPEALYPGGRVLYQPPLVSGDAKVDLIGGPSAIEPPGILSAAPGRAGSTDSLGFGVGTSQATALAAHSAGLACEALERLAASDPANACLDEDLWPSLLKAMVVHPARWGDARPAYVDALNLDRSELTRALGYGAVTSALVTSSRADRAVIVGGGSLCHKEQDVFSLPLPPSLRALAEWRRLTVTLAWISPIAPQTRRRRVARLWFEPPTTDAGVARTEADYNAARRGSVQHEVLDGSAALAFADGDALSIEVNCRVDNAPSSTRVFYGLVASIEVAPALGIDVHNEIVQQLKLRASQRVRVRGA